MKFVAVNRFYRPDHSATSQLLTDLAEHLVKCGHRCVVVTSRLAYEGSASLPKREVLDGVAVHRIWTSNFGRSNLIGRAFDYATFYISCLFKLLALVSRGDTVIAKTDPPLISVVAALVTRMKGAKLVNWCQDLFPEIAGALGMKWADGPLGSVLRFVRDWSLREAVFNAVLHERMAERLLARGIPREQIQVLPNWADTNIRPIPPQQNALRRKWDLDGKLVIGYSGNLGRAHMPEKVVDLVRATEGTEGLVWVFIGSGVGMERVRAELAKRQDVIFQPYQTRDRLSESLSAADIHLIGLDPECEGYVVPSKLYGARAVGRPVLFLGAPDGAVAREVTAYTAGAILDADRPGDWLQAIHELRNEQDGTSSLARFAQGLWVDGWTAELAFQRWTRALSIDN